MTDERNPTLPQTGRREAEARSCAPSLSSAEAEILHNLVIGLAVRREEAGWVLPNGVSADPGAVDALITKRLVTHASDGLAITAEGKRAIRSALDAIVTRTGTWLKTFRRKSGKVDAEGEYSAFPHENVGKALPGWRPKG